MCQAEGQLKPQNSSKTASHSEHVCLETESSFSSMRLFVFIDVLPAFRLQDRGWLKYLGVTSELSSRHLRLAIGYSFRDLRSGRYTHGHRIKWWSGRPQSSAPELSTARFHNHPRQTAITITNRIAATTIQTSVRCGEGGGLGGSVMGGPQVSTL